MLKTTGYKVIAVFMFALTLSVIFCGSAHAATIEVNSKADVTADDGLCTLREAITAANSNTISGAAVGECVAGDISPTRDDIDFNITGTADYTVGGESGYTLGLTSQLPSITELANINGYSQPNSSPNSNPIGLPFNGRVLITVDGLDNSLTQGIALESDDSEVHGLSIVNFQNGTGTSSGNSNVVVSGNLIGIRPDGTPAGNRDYGTVLRDSSDSRLGGSSPADRNVISYSTGTVNVQVGVAGLGSFRNTIQGNYIGTNLAGQVDSNSSLNGGGISISGSDNTLVGGADEGDTNIIAGNRGLAIGVGEVYLSLYDSTIGVARTSIIGNSIYDNREGSFSTVNVNGAGIDLLRINLDNSFQVSDTFNANSTPNDPSDLDTGANNYINFPVLNSITESSNGTQAIINYSLDAADSPVEQYRVEFFGNDEADPSGYGEGQALLGAITSTNGANQQTTLTLPSGYSLAGKFISATTTAIDNTTASGFGSTSEFSRVVQLPSAELQDLASTGQNATLFTAIATSILTLATGAIVLTRQHFN